MDAEMAEVAPGRGCDRGEVMREPDEVAAMVRLKALGWGVRADRAGARVQPHDGPAVRGGGRVDAVPHAGSAIGAGGSRGVAGGAVPAASRQRRRGAAGPGARARRQGQPAHDPAGGVAASARAGGRGAGDGALRDAARAISCRWTSASCGCQSKARPAGCICLWRRWVTRGAPTCGRSGMSASRPGWRDLKARSATSAA